MTCNDCYRHRKGMFVADDAGDRAVVSAAAAAAAAAGMFSSSRNWSQCHWYVGS